MPVALIQTVTSWHLTVHPTSEVGGPSPSSKQKAGTQFPPLTLSYLDTLL